MVECVSRQFARRSDKFCLVDKGKSQFHSPLSYFLASKHHVIRDLNRNDFTLQGAHFGFQY